MTVNGPKSDYRIVLNNTMDCAHFCVCAYLVVSYIIVFVVVIVAVVCIRTVNAVFYDIWHFAFLNVSSPELLNCALSHSLFSCACARTQDSLLFSEMTHIHTQTSFLFGLQNEFSHHNSTNDNRQSTISYRRMKRRKKSEEWNQYIDIGRCSLSIACRFYAFLLLFFLEFAHNHINNECVFVFEYVYARESECAYVDL